MDTLKIGEYIHRLRREKGLTQENLSERETMWMRETSCRTSDLKRPRHTPCACCGHAAFADKIPLGRGIFCASGLRTRGGDARRPV